MRPTTTRRPSPLRILRAHVENKRDAVLGAADAWFTASYSQNPESQRDYLDVLGAAVAGLREARALLGQAEGQAEGPDHG